MLRRIRDYLARRRTIAALALAWSDSIACGIIDASAYNRRRREIGID